MPKIGVRGFKGRPNHQSGPKRFSSHAGRIWEGQPAYCFGAYQGELISVVPHTLAEVIPFTSPNNTRVGLYDARYDDVGTGALSTTGDGQMVFTVGATAANANLVSFNGGEDTGASINTSFPFLPVAGSKTWLGIEAECSNVTDLRVWVGIGQHVSMANMGHATNHANFACVNAGATVSPRVQTNASAAGIDSTTITTDEAPVNDTKFTMGLVIDGVTEITGYFNGHAARHGAYVGDTFVPDTVPVGARMTLQIYAINDGGAAGGTVTIHRVGACQEMV
jgi:hypothetical protein